MSKTELADWIKKIHESGDGSPKGLLAALGWGTLVAKTSNAVLLSAIDSFAQKNGLVKDRFRADDDEERGGGGGSGPPGSFRPEKRPSALPSWSEGLKAARELPKEDVLLSPPDDALLKELEAPSSPEGGDWLEDAVNVPSSTDAVDDLDVVIVSAGTSQPDPAEVTQIFHRPEDDLFGPNGAEGMPEAGGRKPTLPGLPSNPSAKRSQKSLPPPLPPPEGSRPGGRKH